MPLPKRLIEPNFVSRAGSGEEHKATDLETVTNTTLANIIQQLSSLSKHSEDLFAELAFEAGTLAEHTNSLQARIDRLAIKVTQLDSTSEEVSLQDIQLKKAFKSASVFDQQIFSRSTMPAPMLATYESCDPPPPLNKLNSYRDDGKDGLKFYTDPNYFFELWRQEMLKDTERVMHDRGKKTHGGANTSGAGNPAPASGGKKRLRAPQNTQQMQIEKSINNGETVNYQPPNSTYHQRAMRPDSIGLQLSYPSEALDGNHSIYAPGVMITGSSATGGAHYVPAPQSTYGNGSDYASSYDTGDTNSTAYASQQQLYGTATANNTSLQSSGGESIYSPGTPSRPKLRPSQPPPAPPPAGSGGGTPNSASNANTPTRSRSMSTGRDALPPPPPVPEMLLMAGGQNGGLAQQQQQIYSPSQQHGMHNGQPLTGTSAVASMLMARTHSQSSRSGSPLLGQQHQHMHQHQQQQHHHQYMQQHEQNAQMVAQMHMNAGDLPPPPPVPDFISPRQSPPGAQAPPPPPPPPPPLLDNGLAHNGSIISGGGLITPQKPKPHPNRVLPPIDNTRNDLMNAIRSGITLRKVEKSEQKENERNVGLTDVASILARRVAIELSGTDSDSDSDDDSEGWAEHNNETFA